MWDRYATQGNEVSFYGEGKNIIHENAKAAKTISNPKNYIFYFGKIAY